jgi:GR25 family glycosyltransferase involved in LPS biosynthesis
VDKIEKIVYINLDKRKKRKVSMESQLGALDIPYERFAAIAPTDDSLLDEDGEYRSFYERTSPRIQSYFNSSTTTKGSRKRGRGIFGCYLSHKKILENNISNDGVLLILEDDAFIGQKTIEHLESLMSGSFSDKDWDIIRLTQNNSDHFGRHRGNVKKFKLANRQSRFKKGKGTTEAGGTHICVINKHKTGKILDYLNREAVFNIDSVYCTYYINSYLVKPPFRTQTAHCSYSDIPKISIKKRK